jgi:hypothetical protein
MNKISYLLTAFVCCIILNKSLKAATQSSTADDWQLVGRTEEHTSPNSYYYYKLLQVNSLADRYNSIIEVSVQADPNSYYVQGTYTIRVERYPASGDRFDGLEIRCSSGNPNAATFYIYNNAVWIRSNYKWGSIYLRTEALFTGASPLTTAPFGQTLTAPTGYLYALTTGSIKYDFDSNNYRLLPFTDVDGDHAFYKDVSLVSDSKVGIGLGDQFTYDGKQHPHYGFQWTLDSWATSGPTYWLSGYGGLKFFTAGSPKMVVTGSGNVGIGTVNPKAKLSVNGEVYAKRVKVTVAQADWPDYVFAPGYSLPSLQEVERYVNRNRHLPGIPNAEDVEKEGLDVGEMNKKLLQKVEEMTLYIISHNKDLEAKQLRIAALEQAVQGLSDKMLNLEKELKK